MACTGRNGPCHREEIVLRFATFPSAFCPDSQATVKMALHGREKVCLNNALMIWRGFEHGMIGRL
jgi:hypothetical protein